MAVSKAGLKATGNSMDENFAVELIVTNSGNNNCGNKIPLPESLLPNSGALFGKLFLWRESRAPPLGLKFDHHFHSIEFSSNCIMIQLINKLSALSCILMLGCSPEKPGTIPKIQDELQGEWNGNEVAKVRFVRGFGDYVFLSSGAPVPCFIRIEPNGKVEGNLGTAIFRGCGIEPNRGALGRWLNLATDFRIAGRLEGPIFQGDTIQVKQISIPFTQIVDSLTGSIFQMEGNSLFPMAGFELVKKGPK